MLSIAEKALEAKGRAGDAFLDILLSNLAFITGPQVASSVNICTDNAFRRKHYK